MIDNKKKVRETLESSLASMREKLAELQKDRSTSLKERHIDNLDSSQENELREKINREIALLETRIRKHTHALRLFDDFGFCEHCGNDIPTKRLEFDLSITTCVECQHRVDRNLPV